MRTKNFTDECSNFLGKGKEKFNYFTLPYLLPPLPHLLLAHLPLLHLVKEYRKSCCPLHRTFDKSFPIIHAKKARNNKPK